MVITKVCSLSVVYTVLRSDIFAGDAILQRSMLQQQQEPSPQDLAFLQEWMKRPSMGGVYLTGRDRNVWEDPVHGDLIALKPIQKNSIFSSWVTTKFIRDFHRTIGRYFKVCILHISQEKVGFLK